MKDLRNEIMQNFKQIEKIIPKEDSRIFEKELNQILQKYED